MQHNKPYSVVFILALTVACGLLLSLAASALRDRQKFNEAVNIKKNILVAVGLLDRDADAALEEIDAIFESSVESRAVTATGTVIPDVDGAGLDLEVVLQDPDTTAHQYPVFVVAEPGQPATAYAIPVFGRGLWSTLYGYLALEADLETVRGITFYEQKETAGLGAEIERAWFQENFVGKKIFDDAGTLRTIAVVKGRVEDRISSVADRAFYVDGISGATMTGRGVTDLLESKVALYEPYFRCVRAVEHGASC